MASKSSLPTEPCVPFVKWAGGKRWLTKDLREFAPDRFSGYIEPFVGGGAVFFAVCPRRAIISDSNPELINAYRVIREQWEDVASGLRQFQKKHGHDFYYTMRASAPTSPLARTLRFLYLNRTCWNGLYRVNLKGEFNVPKGTKSSVILATDNFKKISDALSGVEIFCQDFEETIARARKGDFVFVDPPYTVKHNLNGFVKYNEQIFSWADQVRLRYSVENAVRRGVKITLTNADHVSIRDLYRDISSLETRVRPSVLASESRRRGYVSELVLRLGW